MYSDCCKVSATTCQNNSLPGISSFVIVELIGRCRFISTLTALYGNGGDIMGSDYEREDSSAATKLTYLIVGGGIGAVLPCFLHRNRARSFAAISPTPPARESRRARKPLPSCRRKPANTTRSRAREPASFTRPPRKRPAILTEKAKIGRRNAANPFTAAIEAGKDAYTAEKRKNESKAITEGRPDWGPGESAR